MAASATAKAAVSLLAAALPVALADRDLSFSASIPRPRPVPVPDDKQCSLEPDIGPCDGDFKRYFFDSFIGCQVFKYGGCEGNSNNFMTEEECNRVCGGADLPVCEQPIIPGPCKGSFPRWGFDEESGQCIEFIYGGCKGSKNNFETKAECEKQCEAKPVDVCELPIVTGLCKAYFPSWGYDQKTGQCKRFIYGGCGGNGNRFATQAECEKACDVPPTDVCELDIVPGPCRASIPSWGFNGGECVEFIYGGCKGNGNRFETQAECEEACEGGDVCSLPLDVGPCEALVPKWGFEDGKCVQWTWGGCEGNGNRFDSEAECKKACGGGSVDICTLPIYPPDQTVFCRAAIPRWTYNGKKGCVPFTYGGCGGTENIFESEKECLAACGKD